MKKQNKSTPDYLKNPNFWIGLVTSGFILVTWMGVYGAMTLPPVAPIASPSPVSAAATDAKCVSSAGNIWSGVNVYSDSQCSNYAGFIMSARDGAQEIKISVDGSGEAWYSRDDVKRLYVKSDDAAIARKGLVMEN